MNQLENTLDLNQSTPFALRQKDGVEIQCVGKYTITPPSADAQQDLPITIANLSKWAFIRLRNQQVVGAHPVILQGDSIYLTLDTDGTENRDHYPEAPLTIGTLYDFRIGAITGNKVQVFDYAVPILARLETVKHPLTRAKIRKSEVKLSSLLTWICEGLNQLRAETCDDIEPFCIEENIIKSYIERRRSRTYYTYKTTRTGDYLIREFSHLIDEIYRIHERTNTRSCMTKGEFSVERGQSTDYDGKLHPFHGYNTSDWDLFLLSEHDPETVKGWTDGRSPFLARAWGWTGTTTGRTRYYYTGKAYGSDLATRAMEQILEQRMAYYGAKVRLYDDGYNQLTMPYIDGASQTVGAYTRYANLETEDGYEYLLAEVCEPSEWDHEWSVDHSTGLAEEVRREHECQVSGEWYTEDEMTWIDALDGYVHYSFASSTSSDGLDGLEILRHFRS